MKVKDSRNDEQGSDQTRVGIGVYRPPEDTLLKQFAQIGVRDILLIGHQHPEFESALPLGSPWTVALLSEHQNRIERMGLELYALETMPIPLYDILLGLGDYDEQLDIISETIRSAGELGIEIIGYSGHPPGGAVRTSHSKRVRGGAIASKFDDDQLKDEKVDQGIPSRDQLWDRYRQFLSDLLPVAERAGVTLALHPSDPPVDEVKGIPILFNSFEKFQKAMKITENPHHQMKFCVGCWSSMGADVPKVIRHFGNERIAYVHMRDVVGTVPSFHETFIDDPNSNMDEYEVVKALRDIGFSGVMTPDHVPILAGEANQTFGGLLGRTYTVGYLRGMIRSITRGNES